MLMGGTECKEKPTSETLEYLEVETWSPWEYEPSSFDWEYVENERSYILEGKATINIPKGEKVEINKGELWEFPKGLKCHWQILEKFIDLNKMSILIY